MHNMTTAGGVPKVNIGDKMGKSTYLMGNNIMEVG